MNRTEPSTADALRRRATARLAAAGVESAAVDAAELVAFVLGTDPGRLILIDEVSSADREQIETMVGRRADRIPLQHLTGRAHFAGLDLAVGPGVFVPRPETELLAGWAIDRAREVDGRVPLVVDLCTGSGAVARAVVDEVPEARVVAVELDPAAGEWAVRNLTGTGVDFRLGDMATAADDVAGEVDVVVCNPPYIPLEAWESVAAEARDHDPDLALFSGADGLDAMRVLEQVAARLLRPGGVVGAEHAEVQEVDAPGVFRAAGRWLDVRDHPDLTGRARYLTARLG